MKPKNKQISYKGMQDYFNHLLMVLEYDEKELTELLYFLDAMAFLARSDSMEVVNRTDEYKLEIFKHTPVADLAFEKFKKDLGVS